MTRKHKIPRGVSAETIFGMQRGAVIRQVLASGDGIQLQQRVYRKNKALFSGLFAGTSLGVQRALDVSGWEEDLCTSKDSQTIIHVPHFQCHAADRKEKMLTVRDPQ